MGEGKSVLRWSGLAGLLAGILVLLFFVLGRTIPPIEAADVEGRILRFIELESTFAASTILLLVGAILALPLYLDLHRMLREGSPGLAPFGSLMGVAGLILFALARAYANFFGAPALADLYLGAMTDAERTTIFFLWVNGGALLTGISFVGALFLGISLLALGIATLGSRDFPSWIAWVIVVLGVVGVGWASLIPFVGGASFAALYLAIFLLLMGWKVNSLARPA